MFTYIPPPHFEFPSHLGLHSFEWASHVVLMVKNTPTNSRDSGSIPGSGRSPRERHGHPFQYSCLENPMGRGTWWATVHRVGHNWSILACSCRMSRGPCAIVGSHYPIKWIVTHFIHSVNSVYMSILISQFIPPPCFSMYIFILYVSVSIYALQRRSSIPSHFFLDSTCMLMYNINFSLSALLHPIWHSIGPSTSLQMTQFWSFLWLCNSIIEKAREFQKNIYFCFIDHAKAFDCVDHNKLWKIFQEMGIPDHLTHLLRNLYAGQEATVRSGHRTADWFEIRKGVCQGRILSPCLFN